MRQVGVTNGVLRCAGALTKLQSLHIPDAFRVTDTGLHHLSSLTGAATFIIRSSEAGGLNP